MKQPAGRGRGEQIRHRHPARRLAEDRDVRRVAAEGRDVLAHPFEGGHLVEQAPVAERALGFVVGERAVSEIAEDAQAIVDGHDHDVAARGQAAAVVER